MTVAFVLYLVTSAYMQPIAIYPTMDGCLFAGGMLYGQLDVAPKPVLGRPVCVPVPASGGEEPKLGM